MAFQQMIIVSVMRSDAGSMQFALLLLKVQPQWLHLSAIHGHVLKNPAIHRREFKGQQNRGNRTESL